MKFNRYHMYREIHEEPVAVQKTVDGIFENYNEIKKALDKISLIVLAARGTSDNAAIFGKYLFQIACGIPTALASPSVFTLYKTPISLRNVLVIGISQSGEVPDVVETIKKSRAYGARTLAITNNPKSALAKEAQFVVSCMAGEEKSVAATKTYTTQLVSLMAIAALMNKDKKLENELRRLPAAMSSLMPVVESEVKGVVERYTFMERMFVLGRGLSYSIAMETALKLKETCYVMAEPFSGADFLHGPIAVLEKGFPVMLYMIPDSTYKVMEELFGLLKKRGADIMVICPKDKTFSGAVCVHLPDVGLPFWMLPVLYVVAGQFFSFFLSLLKGYNPDRPRGLKKITKTI